MMLLLRLIQSASVSTLSRLVIAIALFHGGAAFADQCDRSCLQNIADKYLAAMAKHDASSLEFVANPATTLNSAPVATANSEPWLETTRLGDYRQLVVDARTGQVVFVTAIYEGDNPAILAARLKIEGTKIAEAELLLARNRADTGAHFNPAGLSAPEPAWSAVLPANERSDYERLVAISRKTWTSDARELYQEGCKHYEEGELSSDPRSCPRGSGDPTDLHAVIPVVDPERGLVVSFGKADGYLVAKGFFIPTSMLSGVDKSLTTPSPGNLRAMPGTAYVMQILKVVNGKIQTSEAFMNIYGPGLESPWIQR